MGMVGILALVGIFSSPLWAAWSVEMPDATPYTGVYSSMALDSNGYPHISYADANSLKYVRWTGAAWLIETVVSGGDFRDTSIALDNNDYPHISYYEGDNYYIEYAEWTGSVWSIETIDDTGNAGGHTSIALDSNDYPHISYYDAVNNNLRYTKWTGSAWTI